MKKIAIIGPPGAGKTTLAGNLGPLLKMKVFHLDRLFWAPGWKGKSREARMEILRGLVQEKHWIIEGTYLDSSEPRLNAADTIIFLDTPPLVCLWRLLQRYCKYHGRSRRDIPQGCTDRLTPFRMLKAVIFPFRGRKKLEKKLREFPRGKVVRLRSAKQVKYYLAQLELHTEEKQQSSPSVVKERPLTLISGFVNRGVQFCFLACSIGAATLLMSLFVPFLKLTVKPSKSGENVGTPENNDKQYEVAGMASQGH